MLCGFGLLVGLVVVGAERAEATASNGACCQSSSVCVSTDQFSCEQAGGTFFGNGTSCVDVPCNVRTAVPVFSLLGLVGVAGALGGLGLFRLFRRPQ
jgi:hypothetical protein